MHYLMSTNFTNNRVFVYDFSLSLIQYFSNKEAELSANVGTENNGENIYVDVPDDGNVYEFVPDLENIYETVSDTADGYESVHISADEGSEPGGE